MSQPTPTLPFHTTTPGHADAVSAVPRAHRLHLNGLNVFCHEHPSRGAPMLLLHSLSGNAHVFDGLVAAGLAARWRLLVPEMRGRGRTDAPPGGYGLDEGCADLVALLDHFGLQKVTICGHSFGALLGLYFAAMHPERVEGLAMLDAGTSMHPAAPAMSAAALVRLDKGFPSLQAYELFFRMAPFVRPWYAEMEGFVRADVAGFPTAGVVSRSRSFAASLAALHVLGVSHREWTDRAQRVRTRALVVRATEPFFLGMPMLRESDAVETAELLGARLEHAPGNHFTMLFGPGAARIVAALNAWAEPVGKSSDSPPDGAATPEVALALPS